jgi:hypothetical protein
MSEHESDAEVNSVIAVSGGDAVSDREAVSEEEQESEENEEYKENEEDSQSTESVRLKVGDADDDGASVASASTTTTQLYLQTQDPGKAILTIKGSLDWKGLDSTIDVLVRDFQDMKTDPADGNAWNFAQVPVYDLLTNPRQKRVAGSFIKNCSAWDRLQLAKFVGLMNAEQRKDVQDLVADTHWSNYASSPGSVMAVVWKEHWLVPVNVVFESPDRYKVTSCCREEDQELMLTDTEYHVLEVINLKKFPDLLPLQK